MWNWPVFASDITVASVLHAFILSPRCLITRWFYLFVVSGCLHPQQWWLCFPTQWEVPWLAMPGPGWPVCQPQGPWPFLSLYIPYRGLHIGHVSSYYLKVAAVASNTMSSHREVQKQEKKGRESPYLSLSYFSEKAVSSQSYPRICRRSQSW